MKDTQRRKQGKCFPKEIKMKSKKKGNTKRILIRKVYAATNEVEGFGSLRVSQRLLMTHATEI